MGAIWFKGSEFIETLSDLVGFKTGLALTNEQLRHVVVEVDPELWPPSPDVVLRVRAEEFEEVFAQILRHLGAGPPNVIISPLGEVLRRYQSDTDGREVAQQVAEATVAFLGESVASTPDGGKIDPEPFLRETHRKYGQLGFTIASEILQATNAHLFQNPFVHLRRVEWEDIRELDDLFRSEGLETPHGVYFDQRFVDFLAANFEEIDRIHWRQFEALTAEYFAREGWSVLLGPGRNDGGVDIRLWPDDSQQSSAPATVLVQCKREKRNIQKTVVKALWADVVHEKAESGLIVTTSSFSPGAAATRTARGYPVAEANRRELQKWVRSMRTPTLGPYLVD